MEPVEGHSNKHAAAAVFSVMSVLYFFSILHRVGIAVISFDIMAEFETDASLLGLMSSAYFFPYAAAQLPVGILLDRVGVRKTVVSMAAVACIGSLAFSTGSSLLALSVGRALVGFGVGGFYISALKAIAIWFSPRRFATLAGLLTSLGNVGGIVATSPLALLTLWIGWRGTFLAITGLMAAFAASAWFAISKEEGDSFRSGSSVRADLREVFAKRDFLVLALIPFFVYGFFISFQGLWGGPFLMDVYGMDKSAAGLFLMFIAFGFTIAGPTGGLVSDRFLGRRKPVMVSGIAIGLAFWSTLALLGDSMGGIFIATAFFLLGFGFGFANIYMTISKELFDSRISGTAMASINLFNFMGAGFFQYFMGFLLDSLESGARTFPAYQGVFFMCVVFMILSLVLGILSKETFGGYGARAEPPPSRKDTVQPAAASRDKKPSWAPFLRLLSKHNFDWQDSSQHPFAPAKPDVAAASMSALAKSS
ncbi:MAG: MFS transporter [Candidatus Verstraetearchaeota archaeon]|nr:MFS transporter [Candidatus Verstraetearchaeota archaeon]